MTYRREDVEGGSLVLRLSSRLPAGAKHARITLQPLDRGDMARLVSSMLDGEPLSEEFATFMYERTDGVPLMVEESVRLLRDREDVARRDGQWVRRSVEELRVPPTVRDAVLERLDRLGFAARRVLDALVVLAEPVDQAMVAKVAGLDSDQANAGLAEALTSGLVGENDHQRVAFHHDLQGRAVYEAIPAPERRRLHLVAGTALEAARPLLVVQLTRHFREAGEPTKWAKYAEQAADMAVASNDHTLAVKLLNDALTAAELTAHTRAELAIKLGRATLFRSEAVDDLTREVERTIRAVLSAEGLSPTEQANIRNPLGRILMRLGEWEAGYRELELAAANLSHDPAEAARVMTYLGFPFIGLRPAPFHRQWLSRAADLDSSVQSPVDRLMLLADRATALVLLGEDGGWELAAELPVTAPSREERKGLARAHSNLAWAATVWGRYADARARLAVTQQLCDMDGYGALQYALDCIRIGLDWLNGDWTDLAGRLAVLLDVEVEPSGYAGVRCAAGRFYAASGARDQAEGHFLRALDRAQAQGLVDDMLEPAAGLARLGLGSGRVEDALRVTDEPMQAVAIKDVWVWATEIAPVRVEAVLGAGRIEEARHVVATFARGLRGRNAPAPRAALALCRALLVESGGDHERGATAFSRAARAWERLPRPYDALLARERQAHCLLAADEADETGLALLAEVYERLYELGARGDADRVAQLLREHGAEVPRLWRGGRKGYGDQLSPRELEVVRLVVAGKTNREIAHVLSKSPRTVDVQLRSAMRKLGVSSRTALAVAAVEAGLLPGARLHDNSPN